MLNFEQQAQVLFVTYQQTAMALEIWQRLKYGITKAWHLPQTKALPAQDLLHPLLLES